MTTPASLPGQPQSESSSIIGVTGNNIVAKNKQGILLAGTSLVRDGLMGKGMNYRKAITIGAGQSLAEMTITPSLRAYLAQATGENMWSSLLADSVSLSALLMAINAIGLSSTSEAGGGVINPNLGSGRVGNALDSIAEAFELNVEAKMLSYGLAKAGFNL